MVRIAGIIQMVPQTGLDVFSFFYFLPILNRCLSASAVGQKHCRTVRLGAASDAEYFFLLTVPLHRPPDAGHGEAVNSR